ncbi:hypothetical protein AF72_13420 [Xylella taiwanensis]|uniref:Uncharacterized protein n=1 Tax=Xylella taiwanensis TaxID=1444770 RepID=Z9JGL5_9GAMM|nr:hypothetical protein AF72_13420 [Xylella taiwanensis]
MLQGWLSTLLLARNPVDIQNILDFLLLDCPMIRYNGFWIDFKMIA